MLSGLSIIQKCFSVCKSIKSIFTCPSTNCLILCWPNNINNNYSSIYLSCSTANCAYKFENGLLLTFGNPPTFPEKLKWSLDLCRMNVFTGWQTLALRWKQWDYWLLWCIINPIYLPKVTFYLLWARCWTLRISCKIWFSLKKICLYNTWLHKEVRFSLPQKIQVNQFRIQYNIKINK